jgi:glucuronoarabinoxylan endo-1,4-beta-xylanase
MGNYSRFVRPGFVRIDATSAPSTGVTLTAYKDSTLTKIVLVAINTNTSATSQAFSISGTVPTKVTPWITDATRDLVAQSSQTLTSGSFTYSLPATSVTTLVFDLPASSTGLAAAAPHAAGAPSWSAGILTLPETNDARLLITDARGRSRTVELVQGKARTGMLPAGLYHARLVGTSDAAPTSFVVLR